MLILGVRTVVKSQDIGKLENLLSSLDFFKSVIIGVDYTNIVKMWRGQDIPNTKIFDIIAAYEQGDSKSKIARDLEVNRRTVIKWIGRKHEVKNLQMQRKRKTGSRWAVFLLDWRWPSLPVSLRFSQSLEHVGRS